MFIRDKSFLPFHSWFTLKSSVPSVWYGTQIHNCRSTTSIARSIIKAKTLTKCFTQKVSPRPEVWAWTEITLKTFSRQRFLRTSTSFVLVVVVQEFRFKPAFYPVGREPLIAIFRILSTHVTDTPLVIPSHSSQYQVLRQLLEKQIYSINECLTAQIDKFIASMNVWPRGYIPQFMKEMGLQLPRFSPYCSKRS